MGYLTTIVIHNDAFHDFTKDPTLFGNSIIDGVYTAQRENRQIDVPFKGYANYISVEPSRHADDYTLFVHYGNGVTNLSPYGLDFKQLVGRNPQYAERLVKIAQNILDGAKDLIKKETKARNKKLKEIAKNQSPT